MKFSQTTAAAPQQDGPNMPKFTVKALLHKPLIVYSVSLGSGNFGDYYMVKGFALREDTHSAYPFICFSNHTILMQTFKRLLEETGKVFPLACSFDEYDTGKGQANLPFIMTDPSPLYDSLCDDFLDAYKSIQDMKTVADTCIETGHDCFPFPFRALPAGSTGSSFNPVDKHVEEDKGLPW